MKLKFVTLNFVEFLIKNKAIIKNGRKKGKLKRKHKS